jgi:hypothetical protein
MIAKLVSLHQGFGAEEAEQNVLQAIILPHSP